MNRGSSLPIEKQNLMVLGICLLPVVLFLLISLIPAITENLALNKKIPQEKTHLKEIKKNTETGRQINQFLAGLQDHPLTGRQNIQPLHSDQPEKVLTDLKHSAKSAGTAVVNIRPLFEETEKKSGELHVSAIFVGDFRNLYTMMMNILQLEYMNRIIAMKFDSENKDIRLELTIAVNII